MAFMCKIERGIESLFTLLSPIVAPLDIQRARFCGKSPGVVRIQVKGLVVERARIANIFPRVTENVLLALQHKTIGAQISWRELS